MAAMTPIERVQAVLDVVPPDRPPISFWHHFSADERAGRPAVEAHLRHLRAYDLDFLKVFFDLGYPTPVPIRRVADLASLTVLNGDEGVFGQQLATIRALAAELAGRVRITTTIFNAWATLRRILRTTPYAPQAGPSPPDTPATLRMTQCIAEDRRAIAQALEVIGTSLAHFATRCIEAGADGIFLSVRDDWVDTPDIGAGTYDALVRPSDVRICHAAAEGRFNVLHVCGQAINFSAFAEYPVHVVNWADRTAGPSIADAARTVRPALCGGIDQIGTLTGPSPQDCADQVRDAFAQAGDRPILVAPGCTYDPDRVPHANLTAVREAVETL